MEGKLSGEIEDLSIYPDRSSIPGRGKSIYFVNQSQVWETVFSPLIIFLYFSKNLLLLGCYGLVQYICSCYGNPGFPEFWKAHSGGDIAQGPRPLTCFLPTYGYVALVTLNLL